MKTTKSGKSYSCHKIGYYEICLTVLYGNGQEYLFHYTRKINEFRMFAYASVVNTAHLQYIISSEDAEEIMNYLIELNL